MKRMVLVTVALAMTGLLAAPRAQQVRADVALRAATERETVKGDLKGAIDAYKRIVDGYPKDRAVRAQALVRMAGCYQKLGDAQSKQIYERVIREYADQPVAALARASLARLAPASVNGPALPANRMVWKAPASFLWFTGDVSSDGRLIAYIDWDGPRYDLYVLDLTSGQSRRVLAGGSQANGRWEAPNSSAFSRDAAQLAYSWALAPNTANAVEELRVISMTGGDTPRPRTLVREPSLAGITPRTWSPDGQSIGVDVERKDGTRQVGVVSLRTGELRVLKTVSVRRTSGMHFSPDGRHLLFDLPGRTGQDRDITAIALQDGKETPVVEFPGDDSLLGWTPDGKKMLFTSWRSGAPSIWSAAFTGETSVSPSLMKSDVAVDTPLGLSSTGAFHYMPVTPRMNDVKVGQFDARQGRFTSVPVDVTAENVGGSSAPSLAPDGRSLAYVSRRRNGLVDHVFVIRRLDTGETRSFNLPLLSFRNGNTALWKWARDGSGFYAVGTNAANKTGIHRIDAATGLVSWSIETDVRVALPQEVEGQKLLYSFVTNGTPAEFKMFEWDIAAGRGTELYRTVDECRVAARGTLFCVKGASIVRRDWKADADTTVAVFEAGRGWDVSPDERFLVTYRTVEGGRRAMWITNTATGESRELAKDVAGVSLSAMWWAPDGRALIVTVRTVQGAPTETWWVPADGSSSHRIAEIRDLAGPGAGGRDGQIVGGKMVFQVAGPRSPSELWVMDNFLPGDQKKNPLERR